MKLFKIVSKLKKLGINAKFDGNGNHTLKRDGETIATYNIKENKFELVAKIYTTKELDLLVKYAIKIRE